MGNTGEVIKMGITLMGFGKGQGDMKKSIYDPDDDGVISEGNTEAKVTRRVVATNTLIGGDYTEHFTYNTVYEKVIELIIDTLGVCNCNEIPLRISFQLASGNSAVNVWGRIYRNDVGVGDEFTTSSTTYETFEQVIDGWKHHDKIQLFIKTENGTIPAYEQWVQVRGEMQKEENKLYVYWE
jgi:hypothetical protein